MISYSNQKEVMDLQDLARFLENEQKVQENDKKINADLLRWVETCHIVCIQLSSYFTGDFHKIKTSTIHG